MEKALSIQNENMSVSIFDDGSGEIINIKNSKRFKISPVALQEDGDLFKEVVWERQERSFCDYYPGHFKLINKNGNTLRFALLDGRLKEKKGEFSVEVSLKGAWLSFEVKNIDDGLKTLSYPGHIESKSLVFPRHIGQWMKKPSPTTQFYAQVGHLNMRFIGGMDESEKDGWLAIYDGDNHVDSGVYLSGMAAAPMWLKSMNKWETHKIKYCMIEGGYLEMAKTFREFAKEKGFFRSLKDKIEEVPAVGDLLGGRIISFFMGYTHHKQNYLDMLNPLPKDIDSLDGTVKVEMSFDEAKKIIAEAKSLGMKKGVFNLRGVIKGGYDETHPDIWPFESAYGSEDELKSILKSEASYTALLHDNYQDMYPRVASFPNGVIQRSNGTMMSGGFWHGGQCYIMNSTYAMKYIKRNWEYLSKFEPKGVFIDTVACTQLYEDFHPEHTQSRSGDRMGKTNIMKFYKENSLVFGSEEASDYGMYYIDYLENRHSYKAGESIPLWPLVYHDAAYCARYAGGTSATEAARPLEDILWGYVNLWPAGSYQNWKNNAESFKKSLIVDEWHSKIGLDEMLSHEYLEDGLLERTVFSSGRSVTANFSAEKRSVDGVDIESEGFSIKE